jgi:YesN/AraC family two-component response regulator
MSQERVLIVGDEENERTGLAELVSAWGYPAETARDGAEGFEKVSTWAPSIVVTDLKMPRMGGLELLERIADDGTAMAVIVVTAQGTIDSAVQAMRMGAYDYLTKPIDTERLRTILQNASALLGTRVEQKVTPSINETFKVPIDVIEDLKALALIHGSHGRALQVGTELLIRLARKPKVEAVTGVPVKGQTYTILPRTLDLIERLLPSYNNHGHVLRAVVQVLREQP